MNTTLLTAGIVLVAAAIAGGGLKMLGTEVPMLTNKTRQILLAVFGILLIAASWFVGAGSSGTSSSSGVADTTAEPVVKTAGADTTPNIKPVDNTTGNTTAVTTLSLNYFNAPEYITAGDETLIHINVINQNNAAEQNAFVVLTSPAGTVLKPSSANGSNNNIVSGYTDAQGNFAAYFVWPQSKSSALSNIVKIETSVDQITASGSLTLYSVAYANSKHLAVRPATGAVKFHPIAVKIGKRTK